MPAVDAVADLLAPNDPRVTAAYGDPRTRGASRHTVIELAGHPGASVGVALLCRRPDATGAIAAASSAKLASAGVRTVVTVCARHAFLRDRPRGRAEGSVELGEPVAVERSQDGWRKVRTQYRATGWIPTAATCG
jgi:Bacterial SH3 domain